MDGQGAGPAFAEFLHRYQTNSQSGIKGENRLFAALAYQSLTLRFNSPSPKGDLPQPPRNTLDLERIHKEWENAGRSEEKRWR